MGGRINLGGIKYENIEKSGQNENCKYFWVLGQAQENLIN